MTADEIARGLASEVEDLELMIEVLPSFLLQGIDVSVENFGVNGVGVGGIEKLVIDRGDDFDSKQLMTDLVMQGLDLEVDLLHPLVFLLRLFRELIAHFEAHGCHKEVVFDIGCSVQD